MAAISETHFLLGALESRLGVKAIPLVPERKDGPLQVNGRKSIALIIPVNNVSYHVEMSYRNPKSEEEINHVGLTSPTRSEDPVSGVLTLEDQMQMAKVSLTGEVEVFSKNSGR